MNIGKSTFLILLVIILFFGGIGLFSGLYLASRGVLVLNLDREVNLAMSGSVPFKTSIHRQIDVRMPKTLDADVKIADEMTIPIRDTLEIPLKFAVRVPVSGEVQVDDVIPLDITVPVNIVLSEKELRLEHLRIPLDTEVYIDDDIDLDIVVPLDTEVKTVMGIIVPVTADVPVKMAVPIKQKVRIKDTLTIDVDSLSVPLKFNLPLKLNVPVRQSIHVAGEVAAPIEQTIRVPIEKTIRAKMPPVIPVKVELADTVPVNLDADLDTTVLINSQVPVTLGQLEIKTGDIGFDF